VRGREGRVLNARKGTTLPVISGAELRVHDDLVEDQDKGRAEELLVAGKLRNRISISWPLRAPAECLARSDAKVRIMRSNNEHNEEHIERVLRRRMERRLGRAVSAAAWDLATEQGHVEEALEPAYGPAGEDGLFRFLTALLRVEDGGLQVRVNRRSKAPEPLTRPTVELAARIEAVSRLAAEHAAGDEEILRFRQRVLGRAKPMTAEEAEAYLDLAEARGNPQANGRTEVLRYQNRHVDHALHVWPGSPLDELRKLADSLVKFYPWEPAQAAAFVLEGLIPLATPFLLHLPQTWHETRPTRAKLVMEVDLWMPAASVLRAYRAAKRQVLPGHNRQVSRRSIDLVNFVMAHGPGTWQEHLDDWNTEHPTDKYSDYRRFRFAFIRARKSLLFTTYRPYLGPDHEGDRVS
jgi:hypothetical protein